MKKDKRMPRATAREHIMYGEQALERSAKNIEKAVEHFAIAVKEYEKIKETIGQLLAIKEFHPEALQDLRLININARKRRDKTPETPKGE